ncbi:subtilin [Acrasis kona]|uniref:Subtilin n=1 Tax=Acrasis kona TaxID=1008807 RepID=A0AAW2Z2Q8_9EUKA
MIRALILVAAILISQVVASGTIITVANITDDNFAIATLNTDDKIFKVVKKIEYSLPDHQPIDGTVLCDNRYFLMFINDPKKVISFDINTNQHELILTEQAVASAQFVNGKLLAVTVDESIVELDCRSLKTKKVLTAKVPSKYVEQMKGTTKTNKHLVLSITDTSVEGLPSTFVLVDSDNGDLKPVNNTCGYFADIQFDSKSNSNYGIASTLIHAEEAQDKLVRSNVYTGECEVIVESLSKQLDIPHGNAIYGGIGYDSSEGEHGSYLFSVYDLERHKVSTIFYDVDKKEVRLNVRLPGGTLGKAQFLKQEK